MSRQITDIIGSVVGKVSATVLPQIQAARLAQLREVDPDVNDSGIYSIRFAFGHPNELVQSMRDRSKNPGTEPGDRGKYDMYPIIWLLTDVDETRGESTFAFPAVTLNVVIAINTSPELKAEERKAKNFDPILRPIYNEFLKQLDRSTALKTQSWRQIKHTATDRYFWGKKEAVADDFIDAIEITNLQLFIY